MTTPDTCSLYAQCTVSWLNHKSPETAAARISSFEAMCRELGMDDVATFEQVERLRRMMQTSVAA